MKRWLAAHRVTLFLVLGIGVLRTAVADWNPIPSGSMRPTLLEGDVVLVNRLAYDLKLPLTNVALVRLGEPRHGDVVTFESPHDGVKLIKRLVAMPGDVVELRDNQLVLNGVPMDYGDPVAALEPTGRGTVFAIRGTERLGDRVHALQFLPGVAAARDFGPVVVPPEHYFFLGDNRDDSADSRYVGSVPRRMLIGRAHRVLVSVDMLGDWRPRVERFVAPIR